MRRRETFDLALRINRPWCRSRGVIAATLLVLCAVVYVPATDPRSIRENGLRLSRAQGVRRLRNENGRAVLDVQAGCYTFKGELE